MIKIKMPYDGAVIPPESGFAVWGELSSKNAEFFKCEVRDSFGHIVRHTETAIRNNKNIDLSRENLVIYPENIDSDHYELSKAGFVEIMTEPAYFDESFFRTVIITKTPFYDGIGENFKFEEGRYTVSVSLLDSMGFVISKDKINIKIGSSKETLICRFNPQSHKEAITDWARKMGFEWAKTDLPGYLNPYHENLWLYHMGLLKQYRANDIALYKNGRANMFIHNIEDDSTSYCTEFAYLMQQGFVSNPDKLRYWCYRNGEDGEIINLDNEEIHIYKTKYENKKLTVSGVVRPYQMDPADFVLKDDNTFEIGNYISKVELTMSKGSETKKFSCAVDPKHLFEFECTGSIESGIWDVNINVFDAKGNRAPCSKVFTVEVV